jgi:hypothetical protein
VNSLPGFGPGSCRFCYRCGLFDAHPPEQCIFDERPVRDSGAAYEWISGIMASIAPNGAYGPAHADFLVTVADEIMSLADSIVLRAERRAQDG